MQKIDLIIKHDDELKDTAEVHVSATVDNQVVDFILDTGCSITTLFYNDFSASYKVIEQGEYSGAFGTSKKDKILVDHISLASLKKSNLNISRTPQGGNNKNLLGMDFLGETYFELHLSDEKLIISGDKVESYKNELTFDSGKIPFIDISFEDRVAKAVWDTGAGITIVDKAFVEVNKHLFEDAGTTTGTDSTGTSFETPVYFIKYIEIAGFKFPKHRVVPIDLAHLGPKTGRGMDFILGYSTLKLAHWAMDFKNKKWDIIKTLF